MDNDVEKIYRIINSGRLSIKEQMDLERVINRIQDLEKSEEKANISKQIFDKSIHSVSRFIQTELPEIAEYIKRQNECKHVKGLCIEHGKEGYLDCVDTIKDSLRTFEITNKISWKVVEEFMTLLRHS